MKKSSSKKESLQQKYDRLSKQFGDTYIPEVPTISDDEVRKALFPFAPSKRRSGIVSDSMPNLDDQYNGPIPLGWRETVPSKLPLQGVFGKILKHFAARNFFLGDQVNGWFLQNSFVYKACNMPGEDAVSAGYELVFPRGNKKVDTDSIIKKFNSEEFNLDQTMQTFECYKRTYGGAMMVPCFENPVDMSVPLADYGQFKGNKFLGWTVLEPYYCAPVFEEDGRSTTDPTYKYYMVPDYWQIYGGVDSTYALKIHRSWIFFRRNIITSKIYQPMYKYLGPSIPQMILERLYSAEVCANESSMLLRSKRTFTIEADIRKMVANPEYAEKFLKNCAGNANNWAVRLVPRNSNAKQMDCMLSECMPLTTAQYGILCAEVEIPAPKFMMAQLQGFANSGNYEIKLYAQNLRKLMNGDLKPIIKQTVKFETACQTGNAVEPEDIKFGDIDIATITEEAEIMYEQARAAKFSEEAKAIKKGVKGMGKPDSHKTVTEQIDK